MQLEIIFIHIFFAFILFILLNLIGKESYYNGYVQISLFVQDDNSPAFNFVYRCFSPVVYITLLSALFYTIEQDLIVKDIYFIVIYYFLIRYLFHVFTGRVILVNWSMQIVYAVVSILLSYFVYEKLIVNKEFFFPTNQDIGNAIWLGIIAYLYKTLNNLSLSSDKAWNRQKNYLKKNLFKYKTKYGTLINDIAKNEEQEILIYAVLIYENFNRPKIYRIVENLLFFIGFSKTLGVMQVKTKKFINDEESVLLGAKKIVADYKLISKKIKKEKNKLPKYVMYNIRKQVLRKYNHCDKYVSEVNSLYCDLEKIFKTSLP